MNTIRKSLLVAMAAFSLGNIGAAYAQTAPAPGRHGAALSEEQRAAKFAERQAKFKEAIAKRQQALHDSLKLTAAQEPAWKAFIAATAPAVPATPPVRPDRAAQAQLATPERLDQHLALAKAHLAKQEARAAATKTFYAQLTPEQKTTFDSAAKRFQHGGKGPHQFRRGGPQGGPRGV